MGALFDMLSNIFDIIVSLASFIINSITGFLDMLTKLPMFTALMTSAVAHTPSYLQAAFSTSVAVVIVWMVIKRGPAE